jgi:hypothetical protein
MSTNEHVHRLRVWFARKLLDLAESLPEVKRGPLHDLQFIRECQRKDAGPPYSDVEAPPNNPLSLSAMPLVEAYSIENFNRLPAALLRLFPNLPNEPTHRNLITELDQSIKSLSAGSWWNVGVLLREKLGYSFGLPTRELPELPEQVKYIRVSAHHMLPSTVVLAFDVRLTTEAAGALNRVQATRRRRNVSSGR